MTARRLYAAIAAAVSQMFLLCHLSYAESLADATDSSALEISAAVMESGRCDGIKVRFLGTGAADWKNRSKGTERRRLTSILVDDAILVDYTASDRDMLPCAVIPEAILYTHSHSDHFDAAAAIGTGVKKVYVGTTWFEYAVEAFAKASAESVLPAPEIVPLDIFSSVEIGGIRFTALPANHSTSLQDEQTLIYLIEKNGTRLLYATDTGGIPAAAAKAAGLDAHSTGSPIHGLIMEATMSDEEDFRIFTHSSVGTVLRTVNVLEKTGRYTPAPGQRVYLTHLARTLHGTQQELDASLPEPLKAAFDGLEVVFSQPL